MVLILLLSFVTQKFTCQEPVDTVCVKLMKQLKVDKAYRFLSRSIDDFSSMLLKVVPYIQAPEDPDVGRTVPQLIESRGYVCETHDVTTGDGFILGIHRIVNLKKKPSHGSVLLWHGVMMSSAAFVNNSPGGDVDEPIKDGVVSNNLGFELAKRGYDVWMGNTRGNLYSRKSGRWDYKSQGVQFWNFSLDEFIAYDLPDTIDYILRETKKDKIAYVGHSQGSTQMFGLLSTQAKYNKIVDPFIALSPVVSVKHGTDSFGLLAHRIYADSWLLTGGKFLPDTLTRFTARLWCAHYPANDLCVHFYYLFGGRGWNSGNLNVTRLTVYLGMESFSESGKNMVHWSQIYRLRGNFTHFNYGKKGNLRVYGKETPPIYSFKRITNGNIALFWEDKDDFTGPKDVEILKKAMVNVTLLLDYRIPDKSWSHVDFFWSMTTGKYINSKILQLLQQRKV